MKGTGIVTVKMANKVAPRTLFKVVALCIVEIERVRSITGKIFHRREILVK